MDDRNQFTDGDSLPHFRAFTLPPPGFDVRQATERELLAYGLPRPPNPTSHPVLAARWARIAARHHEFIRPELRPLPIRRHVDSALMERRAIRESELARYLEKEVDGGRGNLLLDLTKFVKIPVRDRISLDVVRIQLPDILALLPETSTNWSGAYVKRPASEPIMTVSGEWTVPGVNPPVQPGGGYKDGTYICVAWVGIDGTSGSNDVLQAGTGSQCVVLDGKVTSTRFFAWTEWFSLPWLEVANLPIAVGDRIACTVCAPFQNTHGVALFNNLTTSQTATIGIDPPAGGTSLAGNVAEWIMEDPAQASGALYPFPVYSGTTFTGCTSGTKNFELNAWDGTELDMIQGGTTLSTGIIQGKQTVFCHYGA
jgi:Peptidase A4 family